MSLTIRGSGTSSEFTAYTMPARTRSFARAPERTAGGSVRVLGDLLEVPSELAVRVYVRSAGKRLSLPGTAGNYASTPHNGALNITGDLQVDAHVMVPDMTVGDASECVVFGRDGTTDRAYKVGWWRETRLMRLVLWDSGGTARVFNATSGLAAGAAADGLHMRWCLAFAGSDATFTPYTSADGVTFTQVGNPVVVSGPTGIRPQTVPSFIGSRGNDSEKWAGFAYRVQVFDGIGGTLVADFDPNRAKEGATSLTASTGEVWTVHQSGDPSAEIVDPNPLASAMSDAYDLIALAEVAESITTHEGMISVNGILGYAIEPVGVDALVTLRFAPTSGVITAPGFVLAPLGIITASGMTPTIVGQTDFRVVMASADTVMAGAATVVAGALEIGVPAGAVTYGTDTVTFGADTVTYGGA